MKARFLTVFAIVAMLFSAFGVGTASAGAYETEFTTSVTYMNVGTATTTVLDLYFFADEADTTPTTYPLTALAANAAGSLFIGSLDDTVVGDGFQGAAYMQSDQPILVTLVQIPMNSTTVVNRALSNGFSAGGPTALVATVMKNMYGYQNTIFSVQNADSETNTVTITLYDTTANSPWDVTVDIEPGAAYYVDAAAIAGIPSPFNGSAVITAERAGGTDGAVVANAMELYSGSNIGLNAFEGVSAGDMTVFMPSALCDIYGGQRTAYAVQNTSLTDSTEVTVTYSVGTDTYTDVKEIGPGAKASFIGCDKMPAGTLGSAVITSDTTPIIAVGKAYQAGLSTAFLGVAMGYDTIALPYVRWATDANYVPGNSKGQRTFIAIQNVGAATITGDIVVEYVGPDGTVLGTHTITDDLAVGAKANTNASMTAEGLTEFGYYGSVYGGAVIITAPAGSELAVIGRVSSQLPTGGLCGEDYNAMPVP